MPMSHLLTAPLPPPPPPPPPPSLFSHPRQRSQLNPRNGPVVRIAINLPKWHSSITLSSVRMKRSNLVVTTALATLVSTTTSLSTVVSLMTTWRVTCVEEALGKHEYAYYCLILLYLSGLFQVYYVFDYRDALFISRSRRRFSFTLLTLGPILYQTPFSLLISHGLGLLLFTRSCPCTLLLSSSVNLACYLWTWAAIHTSCPCTRPYDFPRCK